MRKTPVRKSQPQQHVRTIIAMFSSLLTTAFEFLVNRRVQCSEINTSQMRQQFTAVCNCDTSLTLRPCWQLRGSYCQSRPQRPSCYFKDTINSKLRKGNTTPTRPKIPMRKTPVRKSQPQQHVRTIIAMFSSLLTTAFEFLVNRRVQCSEINTSQMRQQFTAVCNCDTSLTLRPCWQLRGSYCQSRPQRPSCYFKDAINNANRY